MMQENHFSSLSLSAAELLLLYFSIRMGDLVYLCRWLLPFLGHHRKKKTAGTPQHSFSHRKQKTNLNLNKEIGEGGGRKNKKPIGAAAVLIHRVD
jgi:hypothetical protein